nr:DUF2723 domain-containing protein [Chloroflexota bacterium]
MAKSEKQHSGDTAVETRKHRLQIAAGVAVFLASILTYVVTLSPTVAGGDSGELIAAAYVVGVPHPPGYPLYTMLGKLFTLLPLGSVAYRVNLMSALFGALAVATTYFVILRISRRIVPSVVGSLTLAFSVLFWSYSLVAEVFTLNSFFASLSILLILLWRHRRDDRFLVLFAGTYGLGVGHHQTLLFLAPALLYLLVMTARKHFPSASSLVASTLCFLLGFVVFLYLPLAAAGNPRANFGDPSSLERFIRVVTRANYGSLKLIPAQDRYQVPPLVQLPLYAQSMLEQFSAVGILLGLAGFWQAFRRSRTLFVFLLAAFLPSGALFVVYVNILPDLPGAEAMLQKFFILSATVFALPVGLGVWWLIATAESRLTRLTAPAIAASPGLILMGLPLFLFLSNLNVVDQRDNWLASDFSRQILQSAEPNAIILGYSDDGVNSLSYLQMVENLRPDVAVVAPSLINEWYARQLRRDYGGASPVTDVVLASSDPAGELLRENVGKRPVYIYGLSGDEWADEYQLLPRGLVVSLAPKGQAVNLDALRRENEKFWSEEGLSRPPQGVPPLLLGIQCPFGLRFTRLFSRHPVPRPWPDGRGPQLLRESSANRP